MLSRPKAEILLTQPKLELKSVDTNKIDKKLKGDRPT